MTNHPNRGAVRYLKVSPRGFANEAIYLRVPAEDVASAEKAFEGYEDDVERGGFTKWTHDRHATIPGIAVDWAHRAEIFPWLE